jgi:hypothetical protein
LIEVFRTYGRKKLADIFNIKSVVAKLREKTQIKNKQLAKIQETTQTAASHQSRPAA